MAQFRKLMDDAHVHHHGIRIIQFSVPSTARMSTRQYVKLANALPTRLTRFFARYPPAAILPEVNPPSQSPSDGAAPLPTTPGVLKQIHPDAFDQPNPFRAQKHAITGKWHDPTFSLRRQADLVKLAREHGVEELLPFTVKGTAEKLRRRAENGLRVKGTGVGQKVKGKESERTMKARLEKRRQAMLNMPKMIQEWKERGHGRGWKKWPRS
ncbi:hypothetical protein PVAG01_05495 [Phlyctema vagabunda]|uniref:Large ribosomal subunit protein mL59 domain-containing protein n=1 Tax=Phlyctema vagabunda TaxID=108571 RepID=A0ABR4PK99_9HELO